LFALLPSCGGVADRGESGVAARSSSLDPTSASRAALASSTAPSCALNSRSGKIHHVIYIQFDNLHFLRDNPNVPSDLEQMPNLLSFLTGNGTLLSNHHTPLISHTADDIVTSLTGVYPDKHGIAVANSYGYFKAPGSTPFDGFQSGFTYWTDPAGDGAFNLLTPSGNNAPAPWVPFTRNGCNVGAASIADMELENIGSDFVAVFSGNQTLLAQAQGEAKSNFRKAIADYEGIAVHCAAGDPLCAAANNGVPDLLAQEPNGYSGFNALYGNVSTYSLRHKSARAARLRTSKATSSPTATGTTDSRASAGSAHRKLLATWRRCRNTESPSRSRTSRMRTTSTRRASRPDRAKPSMSRSFKRTTRRSASSSPASPATGSPRTTRFS
jgi:hypothetical protein